MAHLTCSCGYYMSNSHLPTNFGYRVYSDNKYRQILNDLNGGVDESYCIPEEDIDIWRCPECHNIYWFDDGNNIAKCYIKKDVIQLSRFEKYFISKYGNVVAKNSIYHTYPEKQIFDCEDLLFEKQKSGAVSNFIFPEAKVIIREIPDENCLYWMEQGTDDVVLYYILK